MQSPAFVRRFGAREIDRPALVDEYLTAAELTHDWASLTGWTATGLQVSGNRLYGISGGNPVAAGKAFAVSGGGTAKVTAEVVRASTSGTIYVGVNFGGANDGVLASLPNFVGVGIDSANGRPTTWVGASVTGGVTTGNTFLTLDTQALGTYRATVAVDAENVSLVLQSQDGLKEWSRTIPRSAAPNGGAVTSVVVWNGATDGTAGSYVKAIGAKASLTPFRTKSNGAGTIEGNAPLVVHRDVSDGWRIEIPAALDPLSPAPIAVYFHQAATGTQHSPVTEARWASLRAALGAAGYVLVSAEDQGDRWGNPASIANYAALVEWVRGRVHAGKVFLIGCSMGGLPMLNTIRHRTMYPIAAAVALCPVCDLVAMRSNATFTASIDAAWGSTDDATLIALSDGYDPISQDPELFRRVPYRFHVGAADTIVPASEHSDIFEPGIRPHAVESSVAVIGTGHLQAGHYDPDLIMPFFESHRGAP